MVKTVLFAFLFCSSVFAFEAFPEYRGLQIGDRSTFSDTLQIDSEYESHLLTYQKPSLWDYQWLSSNNAFDFGYGSLTGKRFRVENRFKVKSRLSSDFDFRLLYFDSSDMEISEQHLVLEFTYWFSKFGLSVFGEATTLKAEDDIGVALVYQTTPNSEFKVFYSLPDFSRNQRNEASDYFLKEPENYGIVQRWFTSDSTEFFQVSWTREPLVKWAFPQQNQIYERDVARTNIHWRKKVTDSHIIMEIEDFRKTEYQTNPEQTQSLARQLWQIHNERHVSLFARNALLSYGVRYAKRSYVVQAHLINFSDVLPYFWLEFINWGFSVNSNFHTSEGPSDLRNINDHSGSENRFNVSYTFKTNELTFFRWLFTFDLDRFGSPQTWEGGAAQLQFSL